MEQSRIEKLIEKAVQPGKYVWADLGSGEGAFTEALLSLGGSEIQIYSVDKSSGKLKEQKKRFESAGAANRIQFMQADFTDDLNLPKLDGILMANSLHFVEDKNTLLKKLHKHLKADAKLVIVEYDMDRGSFFVPHPLSLKTLGEILVECGFSEPEFLGETKSRYWSRMYSAISRPGQ